MDINKVERLNKLFEKTVAEKASMLERKELAYLYKEFFEAGRETLEPKVIMTKVQNTLAG